MAVVTNTFTTASPVGNREELSDVVNRITPEDTPFYTMMKKGSCTSTFPEWETDELAAPAENAHLEGDQYTYGAISAATRMGNPTQIFRNDFVITKTQDKVSNAGSAEQMKYQTLKKGVELRKDIEFALVSNTGAVNTQTRKFASLPAWAESTSRASGGADGSTTAGLRGAATAGTAKRDFNLTVLNPLIQTCYENGANPKFMVMSPYAKRAFSLLISDADANQVPLRSAVTDGQATLIGAADMYQSDFGMLSVVPNRVMAGDPSGTDTTKVANASNVFLVDQSMLEFKWLRPISKVTDISINADATPSVMIGEGTLCVKNPKGLALLADIFGSSATV